MIPDYTPKLRSLYDLRNYKELLEITKSMMKEDLLDGEALYWYIVCLFEQDQKDEAIKFGNEGLHKVINSTWKGRLLNRIGSFYWRIGDLKKAEDYYQLGIEILANHGTKSDLASTINNLGIIFDVTGKLELSLVEYKKALSLISKEESLYASLLVNTGIIYYNLHEDNKAEEVFLEALKIFKEANRRGGIMVVSYQLQNLYIRSNRLDEAKLMFQQIEDFVQTRHDTFSQSLYQISKATDLKTSKRMRDVVETMKVLEGITKNPTFEYEHKIQALIYLTELKLNEFKVLANSDVLIETKNLINNIQDYAEMTHSYPLVIKTKLLKIRLQVAHSDFNNARKMLDATYDFVKFHNLDHLRESVVEEDKYLEKSLSNLKAIIEQNKSEIEKMELNSIQDYLKSIQAVVK